MAIQAIEYYCCCCQGKFLTNKHTCVRRLCEPEAHRGWCTKCTQLIVRSFEAQMARKALPAPKLRLEGES